MRFSAAAALTCMVVMQTAPATADDTIVIKRSEIRDVTASETWSGASSVKPTRLKNVIDGRAITGWIGAPTPQGVSVSLEFAGTRYVSKVSVFPGCAGSNRTFAEFARPHHMVLESSTRTVKLAVADKRKLQSFVIQPPLPVTALKVRVASTYPGKRRATCITELQFHEQSSLASLDVEMRQKLERAISSLGTDDAGPAVMTLVAAGPAAVPYLVGALENPEPAVQKDALRALHRIGTPVAGPGLVRYWHTDPPAELKGLAIEVMARTQYDAAMGVIAQTMASEDFDLADRAAHSVGSFGSAMLPSIERLLKSPHNDVVERAVRAMGRIGDPRVVALARPFCTAPRATVRAAAAAALASTPCEAVVTHCEEALKALQKLAVDEHPTVRLSVVKALDEFANDRGTGLLAELLYDHDEYVAHRALDVLATKPLGPGHLVEYLRADHAPLGEEAVMMLAKKAGVRSINFMIDTLRRGDSRFRAPLRDAISTIGRRAVSRLLDAALLDDRLVEDTERVLGSNPSIALPLIARVVQDDPGRAPKFLIRALGAGKAAGSLPILDDVWEGAAPSLRVAVVRAWSRYPSAAVKDRLIDVVQHKDPVLRREAARAGGLAGVTEMGPHLMAALQSRSVPPEIVIEGLGRLKDNSAMGYMRAHFATARMEVRMATMTACRRLNSNGCIRLLYDATQDGDPDISRTALKLLAD